MAQHEITAMVNEEIVEEARLLGIEDIATVVNAALKEHVERLAHLAALDEWLDEMEEKHGPPSEEAMAWARAAWDEADGITDGHGGS